MRAADGFFRASTPFDPHWVEGLDTELRYFVPDYA